MTRYRVPVADSLLAEQPWVPVEGLRLISVGDPWEGHPDVTICTFEDDNASAELEGALVEPVIHKSEDGSVTVAERCLVAEPGSGDT